MLTLRDFDVVGRTYRNINRYRQILTIIFKYGFGNIIEALKIDQYLEIGLKMISKDKPPWLEPLTQSQRIRLLFEELGPTFIKFGQILSTRPDLIPLEYIFELEKLQDNVPEFSFSDVKKNLTKAFSDKESPFVFMEEKPFASASIGQVHLAKLKTGERVAVKIQRPDIRKHIIVDLEIMNHLATLMERHIEDLSFFRPVKIVEEFAETLEKELDYTLEASNMERVARQFVFDSTIHIPRVYLDITTETVLTMEYIQGIKISETDTLDEHGMDRKLLTQRGADLILKQVFEYGFFHADLHPGNLFVLPDNVLGPVDFGMMGFMDRRAREVFIDLIASVVTENSSATCHYLLELTEYDDEPDMRFLERDISTFIAQYLTKALKHINVGRLLQDLLKITARHKLRLYPDTFLMMKSFAAVEGVAQKLDPDFDMVEYAAPFIKKKKIERISLSRITADLSSLSLESLQLLREIPRDSIAIIRQARKGKFVLGFDIQKLEKILGAYQRENHKRSVSLIISSLIIASSLLFSLKASPQIFGLSLFGLVAIACAVVLWLWLFVKPGK
ncbi:2-octaprenylphenol hydroxylase [Desulfocicer vacuolatum DSM 3385]|uniref:2-octaprenylphenol hydroxylase n=1 Tax=Desulfocicer vacuolatum DSM 3385 TaxID=1121400 RepID=A0A1W2DSC2_9BACT|nr:AarF/UbiB family protein [Desulfocicer vacuolatum]SMD00351.1 2-octaprenylphenol hydroxylase [Desulfocicer vacuolatum DSM 3385]